MMDGSWGMFFSGGVFFWYWVVLGYMYIFPIRDETVSVLFPYRGVIFIFIWWYEKVVLDCG